MGQRIEHIERRIPEKISTLPPNDAYREGWDRIFGEKKEEPKRCTGYYDDGVMPTRCQNREGCGLQGCPASDFGATHDNPSASAPTKECSGGYYTGISDDGDPIGYTCTEQDGCGLEGCPSAESAKGVDEVEPSREHVATCRHGNELRDCDACDGGDRDR